MQFHVIGAGFGRTGTMSLKLAIEQLGLGPCYHMAEVGTHPQHIPLWRAATRGEPTWDRESLPADGVILFDGANTTYASATRGPMPRKGTLMLSPIDWARSQEDLTAVRFIAFPVLPHKED